MTINEEKGRERSSSFFLVAPRSLVLVLSPIDSLLTTLFLLIFFGFLPSLPLHFPFTAGKEAKFQFSEVKKGRYQRVRQQGDGGWSPASVLRTMGTMREREREEDELRGAKIHTSFHVLISVETIRSKLT